MKIALISIDNRENERTYHETIPRFGTGVDSIIEGVAARPDLELHIVSCAQQKMQSPEKLADNIWFHCLLVPKFGWLRTLYQGCIRAMRKKFKEIQPDIVYGVGTEREGAIGAVFSGFPNVVAMAGNMAELARLNHSRAGSFLWLAAQLEDFLLPRTDGVICNSIYTQNLVRTRARRTWLIYPGMRGIFLRPPANPEARDRAVVVAGVIGPRKRQFELLSVAEELHDRGLKCEFRFVGAAPSNSYSKLFFEKLKTLEAPGCARYFGTPPHAGMVEIFDRSSGMIHFPSEEAFGSVVAEGFARNLKFFGARTGGIIEIAEGVPGAELFDKEDWAALTTGVAAWVANKCPTVTGASEIMKSRYSPEIYVRQHLDVFQKTINLKE